VTWPDDHMLFIILCTSSEIRGIGVLAASVFASLAASIDPLMLVDVRVLKLKQSELRVAWRQVSAFVCHGYHLECKLFQQLACRAQAS
jgi:hypothetical protein